LTIDFACYMAQVLDACAHKLWIESRENADPATRKHSNFYLNKQKNGFIASKDVFLWKAKVSSISLSLLGGLGDSKYYLAIGILE